MYSLFQIYKSPDLLPFQLVYNSNDWKWDLYKKSAIDNVIPAFFSRDAEYTSSLPTISTYVIRKLVVSDLQNGTLTVDQSFNMPIASLKVKETKTGYYQVYLPQKYQSTEIDLTNGIFQVYFTMSNSDIFYSDLICLKGTPVPSFSCSLADYTSSVFTIRVTRTDSEAEAESTGTLTVNLYSGTTLVASILQEFSIDIGNFEDLTFDFTGYDTGITKIEWDGVCTGDLTPTTWDRTDIKFDSDLITFDETYA